MIEHVVKANENDKSEVDCNGIFKQGLEWLESTDRARWITLAAIQRDRSIIVSLWGNHLSLFNGLSEQPKKSGDNYASDPFTGGNHARATEAQNCTELARARTHRSKREEAKCALKRSY